MCAVYRLHQPLCKDWWCLYELVLPSHYRTMVSYLYGTLSLVLYPVETNNYYYTFNSLSIISLAKSLRLILEISTTYMYRLVSYLLADKWLICMLHTQCMYYFQSWAMSKFNRFHATVYLSLFISKQCTNKSVIRFCFCYIWKRKVLVSVISLGLRLGW